jgi:hypothetical protein
MSNVQCVPQSAFSTPQTSSVKLYEAVRGARLDVFAVGTADGGIENGLLASWGHDPTDEECAALLAIAATINNAPPVTTVSTTLVPDPGAALDLGSGAQRFGSVYATDVNTLSDARAKRDVADLAFGLDFARRLRPVAYRRAGGRRLHFGLLAQEVAAALDAAAEPGTGAASGSAADYGVWCRDAVADARRAGLPEGLADVESLRYEELVPVLLRAVQELAAGLDEARAEIAALKAAQ